MSCLWGRGKAARPEQGGPEQKAEGPKEPSKDTICETVHTVQIGGKAIEYIARAGLMSLKEDKEDPKLRSFHLLHAPDTQDLRRDPSRSPSTAARVVLSVAASGLLGPRRVSSTQWLLRGSPISCGQRILLLDQTDLVFIDPVAPASRERLGRRTRSSSRLEEDVRSVGEFIRLYTTRTSAGPRQVPDRESYGTTRAAGLRGTCR